MPPKPKRNKIIVTSKENDFISIKSKLKNVAKNTKTSRKALSDKTNSASDDDPFTSPKLCLRTRKTLKTIKNVSGEIENLDKVMSSRNKKLPKNNFENQMGKNSQNIYEPLDKDKREASQKRLIVLVSPLKIVETSLADSRPKRICRLPLKFEDHSISPSKYIPVQPIQASTPVLKDNELKISTKVVSAKKRVQLRRNLRTLHSEGKTSENSQEIKDNSINSSPLPKSRNRNIRSVKQLQNKEVIQKPQKSKKSCTSEKHADSNNNANDSKENKTCNVALSCNKKNNKVATLNKDSLIKVSDKNGKALKRDASSRDVYEFTYDPTEEPPPQKKKRKRVVQKKQQKTKPVFTMNYDKNVTKSIANLKKMLSTKSKIKTQTIQQPFNDVQGQKKSNAIASNVNNVIEKENNFVKNVLQQNFNSFHVEDIVLNNETVANDNDFNYSPVNSPIQIRQPSEPRSDYNREVGATTTKNDPLNLQDDLSFFDDQPAASSSVNVSVRNPSATPWRAEFEQLPIKWHVNTYVKANMTPAFESSFIDFNNKKKHVYTNMVPEQDVVLPEIVENETASKLKQTSIISFFKEVVEKNEKKKSKIKATPVKENSLFEDVSHTSSFISPIKQNAKSTINKMATPDKNKSSGDIVNSPEYVDFQKESPLTLKQKTNHHSKNNKKDTTYFGFDDSEELDQENLSPTKKLDKQRIKALRPRARAILQEFNMQTGPTRAAIKLRTSNKIINSNINKEVNEEKQNDNTQEKAIDDAAAGSEADNVVTTNTINSNLNIEDSQSVHLFEDLELIHHLKPSRKSYGKSKKVTFRHNSESSDNQDNANISDNDGSSLEEDNLDDLTFQMPSIQQNKSRKKKTTKKKQPSKKEQKEAEAWAAGFNSMCEDVDQFDLIVE